MKKSKISDNPKKIVFYAFQGVGKNIMATAVCKAIRKQYPDSHLVVVASHPEVFSSNMTLVDESIANHNIAGYHARFVNKDTLTLDYDPYKDYGYLNRTSHLIKAWCEGIGVPYNGETPEISLYSDEIRQAKAHLRDLRFLPHRTCLLQWCGGVNPREKKEGAYEDTVSSAQRRSLSQESASAIAKKIKDNGFDVLIIKGANQPEISLPTFKSPIRALTLNLRMMFAVIKVCKTFVGIDSAVQHAAMALGKKGTVLWAGTDPKVLGYDFHKNITQAVCSTPMCHRPMNFMNDIEPNGQIWRCPHGEPCMDYDADLIGDMKEWIPTKEEKKEKLEQVIEEQTECCPKKEKEDDKEDNE